MTACAPIAQAHALGIVHRDLKPSNLFLAKKGDACVLKVLDFGIAKILSEQLGNAKITSSMFGLGTPHYMSPEQVRGSSNVDGRSDVWALGIILYELLTGDVPFPPDPAAAIAAISADPIARPRTLREEIPIGLDRVIMCALAKDRDKRYQTALEFAAALEPFASTNAPDVAEIAPTTSESPPRPTPFHAKVTEPEVVPEHQPSIVSMPPAVTPIGINAVASAPSRRARSISLAGAGALVLVAMIVTWRIAACSSPAVSTSAVASVTFAPVASSAPSATASAPPTPVASVAPVAAVVTTPEQKPARRVPQKAKRATAAAASAVPTVGALVNPLML
jgi:serine/threonine-protein kinase